MKKLISLILLNTFFTAIFAQDNTLKTWAVMKNLIGMETTAAETLIKSHGYKYDRSFEGLGIKFKEYGPANRNYLLVNPKLAPEKYYSYDNIILGERKGKIDFIKFEFVTQDYKKFESDLVTDKFEPVYDKEDFSDYKAGIFSSMKSSLKIRSDGSLLFIYKNDISLCLPSLKDIDNFGPLLTKRIMKEDDDGIKSYVYNDKLKIFSCSQNDTGAIEAEKVQILWNLYKDQFTASINGFNLENAHIMFYAVRMTFTDFLYDMFKTYQLDINLKYLPFDMTVLDFCRFEIEEEKKGTPVRQNKIASYESQYKMLRKLGAKHSEEL